MAVSDMVEAVCRIVERRRACDGQIFNLGNPNNDVSIAELGQLMAKTFAALVPGAPVARFEHVSAEAFYGAGYDDTAERIPDMRKARRLLGWQPSQSLASMLPGIVRDYVERYRDSVTALPQARSA